VLYFFFHVFSHLSTSRPLNRRVQPCLQNRFGWQLSQVLRHSDIAMVEHQQLNVLLRFSGAEDVARWARFPHLPAHTFPTSTVQSVPLASATKGCALIAKSQSAPPTAGYSILRSGTFPCKNGVSSRLLSEARCGCGFNSIVDALCQLLENLEMFQQIEQIAINWKH